MEQVYNGRIHKVFSRVTIPKAIEGSTAGGYLYFLRIGAPENRKFKIGTSNDVLRRMVEHATSYKEPIYVLWVSPLLSKYTTLRIEDRQKQEWIDGKPWDYIKNDRFIIPKGVDRVGIRIRKIYEVALE